jgi:drug/metabolite transporter (DMT)-like permease
MRRRGQIYVALATLAWSSAGVLQRELHVGTATQMAGRALFAVAGVLAYIGVAERRHTAAAFRSTGVAGLGVAVFTAVASASFIVALNHASVASVLFMQALAPLAAGLIAWLALGEPIARRTLAAMAIALAGVALMVGGPGGAHGLGLALSVVMTLAFAASLVITRHRRDVSMAPALCLSQLLVFVVGAPFSSPGTVDARDAALFVALGVGQIGVGFVLLSLGARLIPAAEVALISLLEIALGPLWVWLVLSERPSAATLAGGVVVVGAVAVQAGAREPAAAPI